MAKQAGSESKAPLVIFLVLFVLLSGVLGYTTYTGYEAKDKAEQDKKKAEDAKKEKDNEADYYKFQALLSRTYMGQPQAASNDSLVTLRNQYNSHNFDKVADPNKAETDTFIKGLEDPKKFGWNDAQKRPTKTYESSIKELTAKVAEQDTLIKTKEKDYNDLNDLKIAETKKRTDAQAEYDKNLKEASDKLAKSEADRRASTLNILNERDENKKIADEAKLTIANLNGLLQKALKERDENKLLTVKLQQEIDALKDDVKVVKGSGGDVGGPLGLGPKRGEILRVDTTGERPFINLGSMDKLQAGQTFAVQRLDADGKSAGHRISVSVFKVIGEHVAQVEVRDQDLAAFRKERSLNPLNPPLFLAGDGLYNPSFNPDQPPRHAVLVGRVTAGRPDEALNRKLLENALKKQNIILDPALSRATDWLIVGESATPEDTTTINETEARAREMGLLRKDGKIVEMRLFLEKHGLSGLLPPALPGASLLTTPRPPVEGGGDKPGGDKPGGDKPGGDKPGGDKPGGDKPGGDKPGGDKPGGNKPMPEK
jgi:hypothetical protein